MLTFLRDLTALVRRKWPSAKITRAVAFCHPRGHGAVDCCHAILPGDHWLEWCFCNCDHVLATAFDFDGILCRDCPPADDDDGPRYRAFLRDAVPYLLPRRKPVPLIVTARHERYRTETAAWLARHGVQAAEIVFRDFDYVPRRGFVEQVAEFKARVFRERPQLKYFLESDPPQAERIAQLSGKASLCPAAGRMFRP